MKYKGSRRLLLTGVLSFSARQMPESADIAFVCVYFTGNPGFIYVPDHIPGFLKGVIWCLPAGKPDWLNLLFPGTFVVHFAIIWQKITGLGLKSFYKLTPG